MRAEKLGEKKWQRNKKIMDSEYVKKSHKRALKENKERHLHGKPVYIQDPLPEGVDLDYVIKYVQSRVPSQLMYLVDSIYVGNFEFLNKKNVNALYLDSAIYVSNKQSSEEDMIDDIIHETAHSVEELAGDEIYFDGEVEKEFLGKRQRLCDLLGAEGYKLPTVMCYNTEYNENFDEFLYQTVGYEALTSIAMGLFYSPYAITSLREYFANGFEHYFIGDKKYLKNISPILYNKIINIIDYD